MKTMAQMNASSTYFEQHMLYTTVQALHVLTVLKWLKCGCPKCVKMCVKGWSTVIER